MGICSIAVVKNVHYKPRKIQNGYNEQNKSKRQSKFYYVEKAYS